MAFDIALLKMPLYGNIKDRTLVYWFANIGVSHSTRDPLMICHPDF
jgi:hypothetical protein